VSVPLAGATSPGTVSVTPATWWSTDILLPAGAARSRATVNVPGVVPRLPSVTDGLVTARASGAPSSIVGVAELRVRRVGQPHRERLVGLDDPVAANGDVRDALDVARSERQPTGRRPGPSTRKSIS
jgi:hypothetical protein